MIGLLKRATYVALFIGVNVFSAPKTETYKDIIEKAQNLSLQKDRGQAVLVLTKALARETKKSLAQKELTQALEEVSTFFYSDKAQQLYELALTLKTTDVPAAISKLQEASRIEPDNLLIQLELGRIQISSGDCSKALGQLKKLQEQFQFLETAQLAVGQAAVCAGNFEDYTTVKINVDMKKSALGLYWTIAELEYLNKTGSYQKLKELVLQRQEASYPELLYWAWRADVDQKIKADKLGQKYLAACKNLSLRTARQHQYDPTLCKHLSEVETYLKRTNNSDI